MAFHTNTRRVFDSWRRAARIAHGYGMQTGWKHRVTRVRGGYQVTKTERRIGPFKPFAKWLGPEPIRMVIEL